MYDHVIWPLPFDPKTSAIYALNDIDVNAPPEVVWKLLVDAENWSSYFPAEDQVKILTGEPELALGTKYSRVTVGFPMHLLVTECAPGRRLAWSTLVDGDESGSSAYHGWVIAPTDTGCHLLSEETQQGPFFLEELGRKNPGALYRYHEEWVDSLARAAEAEAEKAGSQPLSRHPPHLAERDTTMAKTDIEKVLTIFQGISAGDVDLATQYIDDQCFVQHNPYAGDGVEGLTQFISQSPRDQLQLTVVRVFQDGHYVVTQAGGQRSGRSLFFDIFRFEDGLVVEHWAFSAMDAPPNLSGHTQTDGPTEVKLSADTEKNKSIVREYYETIHVSGDHNKIPQYFQGDHCIRHEPGVRDGVTAFKRDLEELTRHRRIDEIKFVLGQGDFVFIAAKGSHESRPCIYIDLYRVEDEKIAERWGFPEELPPQKDLKNYNGML
jgi:predicted SnoaL-like aldol condensation-catalyzing enzyme/uncharacterized protein YndB with AHSA1/START domain